MIASSTRSQTRVAVLSEETSISGSTRSSHSRLDCFYDHGFIQCVDRPTHEKGGNLDVVAVRSIER